MSRTREYARGNTQEKAIPAVIKNGVVDIDKLIPYVKNVRLHSDEQVKQIAASIAEFGATNPVLVWKNNEIIAGHGRVMAMKLLLERDPVKWAHLREVDVRRCDDLTDEQRRALVLADNKLALNASWDADLLKGEIEALENFDLSVIGFSNEELETLFIFEGDQIDPQPIVSKQQIQTPRNPIPVPDSTKVANEHWVGMPEFNQQDKMPYKTLYVHFKNEEAVQQFATLISQNITDRTRFIWYPGIEIAIVADKVYMADE